MLAYIVRRILLAGLTMTIMSMLTFVVISLPEGDYVTELIRAAQQDAQGSEYARMMETQLREYYSLDKPAAMRYLTWVSRIVTKLEFAHSFGTQGVGSRDSNYEPGRDVTDIIKEPLKLTIALTSFTITITWMMGIPIGIYSAVRQHTVGDYVFTFIGFTGLAVPDFLLGLVMMYAFFAYFDMSVGGLFSGDYQDRGWSFGKFMDLAEHMIIPAVVLGSSGTASLIRVMRNNLLDELRKPYVTTARAKGMTGWKVVLKYPVRVAVNPFISGIGQTLPALVGGSVIVSVVLSLPTLGPVLLDSIRAQDTYLSGAIILLLGLLTVIGILISDILLVVVDPRIRLYGR